MPLQHQFVLTLARQDAKGSVPAASGRLYQAGCNRIDSQPFGDLEGENATARFVTADPNAGPIIEQDAQRVEHGVLANRHTRVVSR